MARGKKYTNALEKVQDVDYSPLDAINLVKEIKFSKYDETLEVHYNLGIDPRHADQQIRSTISLPHGTGKSVKILVLTDSAQEDVAKKAGADYVGAEDLLEKIKNGWFDFDLIIATPNMMPKIGKYGKILGSKGLMPNPKSGTVTTNLAETVKEFKQGKVEYRNDKYGIVHMVLGKLSFDTEKLLENFNAFHQVIEKAKPSKAKGVYLKSISISGSNTPGVSLETNSQKWKG